MMVNMNYYELVEQLKAKMDPFGHCKSCGHEFVNERDIQLDHILPPRHKQDTARLHARNIQLLCASCNNTKGAKDYAVWLDEQDAARLTNESANKPRVPYPDSFDEWRRQHDSVKQPGPKADASSNGGKLLLGFAD
jgi:HNH endonuclease.